jgi:cell division protein ZapD
MYDIPLTETSKLSFRLESLFKDCHHYLESNDEEMAITHFLQILYFLDRTDFKSKLIQAFINYTPQIKEEGIKKALDESVNYLQSFTKKLNHFFESNDFLNALKSQQIKMNMLFHLDLPLYAYWLQKKPAEKKGEIEAWLSLLAPTEKIITLLNQCMRSAVTFSETLEASSGYYEYVMSGEYSFANIKIESPTAVYPEVSTSKNRLYLYFYTPRSAERPIQYKEAVTFTLSLYR